MTGDQRLQIDRSRKRDAQLPLTLLICRTIAAIAVVSAPLARSIA